MNNFALLAALLLAAPAPAQTRVAAPATTVVPIQVGVAPVPDFLAPGALSPSLPLSAPLPLSVPSLTAPAPMIAPAAIQAVRPAAFAPLPVKVAALNAGVAKAVASFADNPASGSAALSAGRDIEALLTGAVLSAPSAADAAATLAELDFVLGAAVRPEDPDDYASVNVPGSIFGWQPIEKSPGHGFPPLDALIRRALAEKKSGYAKGFELPGAARREDARIHFYGERHTDGALIAANMKRLASDARPGKPVIVLVEGYTGWSLRGWPAVKYLADRRLEPGDLKEKGIASGDVEVRGWDVSANYDASKHPLLQHHMDLLALNHLAHGELRGWRYYREVARAALTAWRSFRELWKAAIVARNVDLDDAVRRAAADAGASGATVHVIAGTDHLMQNPRLAGVPLIGRPSFRGALRDALGGRPFWASQPPNTLD